MVGMTDNQSATLDREEIARFARLAGDWWDTKGPFKPLHRINPVRLTYIRDQLCKRFGRDPKGQSSLSGLSVLDIGCGGGLVSEPLARLGASVRAQAARPFVLSCRDARPVFVAARAAQRKGGDDACSPIE